MTDSTQDQIKSISRDPKKGAISLLVLIAILMLAMLFYNVLQNEDSVVKTPDSSESVEQQ